MSFRSLVLFVVALTAFFTAMLIVVGEGQPPYVDVLASVAGLGVGLLIALGAGAASHDG